jgi:hypothetical protein
MSSVPLAVPFAWSTRTPFFLQGRRFNVNFGGDSQLHRRTFR